MSAHSRCSSSSASSSLGLSRSSSANARAPRRSGGSSSSDEISGAPTGPIARPLGYGRSRLVAQPRCPPSWLSPSSCGSCRDLPGGLGIPPGMLQSFRPAHVDVPTPSVVDAGARSRSAQALAEQATTGDGGPVPPRRVRNGGGGFQESENPRSQPTVGLGCDRIANERSVSVGSAERHPSPTSLPLLALGAQESSSMEQPPHLVKIGRRQPQLPQPHVVADDRAVDPRDNERCRRRPCDGRP